MTKLSTKRLLLFALNNSAVKHAKLNRKLLEYELGIGFTDIIYPENIRKEIDGAMAFWLENTEKYPDKYQWYTNWEIILKSERRTIGGIGFGGYPKDGKTSLGYFIDPRFQGNGYATEAIEALLKWGSENSDLNEITAETPVGNLPSQKVLQKNGFRQFKSDSEIIVWIKYLQQSN